MQIASVFKMLLRRPTFILLAVLLIIAGQFATHPDTTRAQPDGADGALLPSSLHRELSVDGVAMVHVPKDCFLFDDPVTDSDAPGPAHDSRCFESGFWIDKYEVTNADFARLHGQAAIPSDAKHPRQPRAHITWYEADAFCKLRGGALPDETDWEYAARGPKNLLFPNGNKLRWGTFAGFRPDGTDGVVADVGSYPASASWVGAQDMIGNVWEWTATQPERNLRTYEKSIGDQRVIRGGAVSFWDNFDVGIYLTAFRMSADANIEAWDAGFRCIKPEKSGQMPTATSEFNLDIPTPTNIATPTDSPRQGRIDPDATLIPAGTSNSAWAPVAQSFGDFIMDHVPAGCFDMGTDFVTGTDNPTDPGLQNENPRHRVCLTVPYWIDQYEVTNAQYKRLTGKSFSIIAATELPISPISWDDANFFCKLRGGQLPTEAQWEYAARGPQSWVYPWGNDFDYKQNYTDDIFTITHGGINPKNRSWIGAFDISENVMEWVADWYAPYAYSQSTLNDPQGPASGTYRVLRGGSYFGYFELSGRGAYRNFNRPDVPVAEAGIRCIRPVQNATNVAATAASMVPTIPPTSAAPIAPPSTPTPTLIPAGTANALWMPITAMFRGVTMQRVPAGCFIRGDADADPSYGYQQREICITKPFWIDQMEVTNDTFARLGGRALINIQAMGKQRPRNEISWDEAKAFCIARGGRLPTEAQWEYATQGPESLKYPWGNEDDPNKEVSYLDDRSWPSNVGSRPAGASWVGAMDMSGNLSEWVMDWGDNSHLENSPQNDPTGPEQGTERVIVGSSYKAGAYGVPSLLDERFAFPPTTRYNFIGFRCILPDSAMPDKTPLSSPTLGK